MLFQLPPAFSPLGSPTDQDVVMNLEDSKENCSENSAASPSRLSPSIQQYSLPYRSIFAVLTWDSVLIYDTVHDQPLAVVRDIHYAHLVDATWTPDGRNLLVCSTDGYISILRFDAGELGEVYLPPPTTTTLENYSPPPLTSDAFNGASPVSGRSIADVKLPLVTTLAAPLPPCEPGPYTVHCPPAKRAKVRIAPTPVEASIMQSISTTNIDMSLTSADISASSTATDAMVSSETQKRTATDAELAVDKLSLTDSAASSTVQPTKKLKKRIQATLMPVS